MVPEDFSKVRQGYWAPGATVGALSNNNKKSSKIVPQGITFFKFHFKNSSVLKQLKVNTVVCVKIHHDSWLVNM